MFCRDRFGLFKVDSYKLLTCTMCYAYLFPNSIDLHPDWSGLPIQLAAINGSRFQLGTTIYADIQNVTLREMICSTLEEPDCLRWVMCCEEAIRCCDHQLNIARSTIDVSLKVELNASNGRSGVLASTCPMTWDGYACWESTDAGTRLSQTCPSYIDQSDPTEKATKDCTVNGTWWEHPTQGQEWTNYTACVVGRLDALVNVVIDIVLRLTDSDGNGAVSFQEVGDWYDQTEDNAESKGYTMTAATIVDTDGNRELDRNEMETVVQTLLREVGKIFAARLIETATYLDMRMGRLTQPTGDEMVEVILQAMNSNNDRIISLDEMRMFYHDQMKFRYYWDDANRHFQEVDGNFDNKLNKQEIRAWSLKLMEDGTYYFRQIFNYNKIKQLAGDEVARLWAGPL